MWMWCWSLVPASLLWPLVIRSVSHVCSISGAERNSSMEDLCIVYCLSLSSGYNTF